VGDLALVFGDGMVGLWTAQTLAWRGAEVILVGRHDERLRLFANRPFRHAVNTVTTDWKVYLKSHFTEKLQVAVDTVAVSSSSNRSNRLCAASAILSRRASTDRPTGWRSSPPLR